MSLTQTSGGRIKLARNMLGLSRKELEESFHISVNTLQAWESDKNSLTDKGAKKLNNVFIKLGLLCTEDWLLAGKGQAPILLQDISTLPNEMNEDICILREIEAFKAINPNPTVVMISDDGMEPIYTIGDFVGGNKKSEFQIERLIGERCIIETFHGDTLVRKLLKGSKEKLYNLVCINIATHLQPIIPDIKIRSAARIVLHRKKEDSANNEEGKNVYIKS